MARLLIVAAGALIDGDGRVLIARRPAGKEMAGLWEFPGGKLDEGETPEGALVRELKEELGIDVEASCLAPIAFSSINSGDFHLLMPLFACRKWKGVARPIEADALAWVKPAAFHDYEMPPADRPLAAQLRDML
ncbi:MAG: (deoxy)nucleoside triphosphate pyrophosphohydrolase [Parvularculaceae bacterium]|nr:(deoxy)nucleoside triphosphate pyrophosphohydrolase [Parvularculaceae bacterium]